MSVYLVKNMRFLSGAIWFLLHICTQAATPNNDLFFKFEHTPADPYLHQQVIYTVKLYQRVPFFDGNYLPPHLDHAVIFPLGAVREYHTILHGEMYTVAEQRYAVFPQMSGLLSVYGPSLDALTNGITPNKVQLRSELSTLHVLARPLNHTGDWLPAKNVQIKVLDDVAQQKVARSQAIVRTITLSAQEIPAELLPTLSFQSNSAWSVYVGKPIYKNKLQNNNLHSQATYLVTYVFNHPGPVTLPAQKVSWFNTASGALETASLPARKFFVLGALIKINKNTHKSSSTTFKSLYFCCISVFLFITGLYLSLKDYIRNYRKKAAVLRCLSRECLSNQAVSTSKALICWARYNFPNEDFLTLNDVMNKMHNTWFKHQINILLATLYKKNVAINWNGQELWRCVVKFNRTKIARQIKKSPLPPLNHS